jgi:hypothetical protein
VKHHHFFPTLLTVFASLAVAHAQPEAPVRWAVDRASGPGTTAGFSEIDGVQNVELMRVTPETGMYSHHPHILHDGERFFAAWSNHRVDEDGPGQRVLFSTSADGRQWTEPAECFPPLGPAEPAGGQASLVLTSNGLHDAGGTVYAVVGINGIGPRRFGSRPCYGNVARSVAPDGALGPMFMLADEPPPSLEGFEHDIAPPGDPRFAEAAAELIALRYRPDNCPSWSFRPAGPGHEDYTVATGSWKSFGHSMLAADGHRMCEPTSYRRPDGVVVRLFRDLNRSRRVYASLFDEAQETWSVPQRTNIPDSPSRAVAGRLPNGGVYLVGNQTWAALEGRGGRDPLVLSTSRDGVTFDRAWIIRAGAPKMRHRGRHKGPGFQYPHATVVGDDLWVIYSINKEDVAVTRIPLALVVEAMAEEPAPLDATGGKGFLIEAESFDDHGRGQALTYNLSPSPPWCMVKCA